ncbi:hypothetical protein ACOSP7_018097 [Xanthoceras sorbifolium]
MGHRRFLPVDHKWQKQIRQFDSKKENKVAPKRPSGDDLKGYVRNKARPEGSIAEGYLIDECLTFCSQYIRLLIFKKYVSVEDRMAHCPDNIPPPVWNEMVQKWMKKEWQNKNKRNKDNSKAVDMYHTTGSIPMAKYKSEEETNTEIWTHEKAKQLYVCITLQIYKTVNFLETVGKPSHGHILGLGVGVKAKDVYGSSSDESSKRARVDKREELELKIKSLTEELQELRWLVSSMIFNSDTQRPLATTNVSSNADVEQSIHVDEEQSNEDVDNW